MANGGEFTEVWESDCGPGSSGKLACAHCDIYYSWGNGQSWPREANLNILSGFQSFEFTLVMHL